MRKFIFALSLAAAALATPACKTIQTASDAVALANQNVGDFTIMDEKAWYYATALYVAPAQAYLAVNSRGLFAGHDDLRQRIKSGLQELNRLRIAARTAYKTGNAVTFHEKLTQMKALSDQVRNLIPSQ